MVAQSNSESSAQEYHLLPDPSQCKAKHLFRSCFPPMLAYNMQPIRYSEKENDQNVQYGDRYKKLPDIRVSIAATDLGYVHAIDAADNRNGCESVTTVSMRISKDG